MRFRSVLAFLIGSFLSFFLVSRVSAFPFIRGDSNADGKHDVADAIASLSYLFQGQSNDCLDALDVNDDGMLDVADPISLLGYLFASSPPPGPPFPGCGEDPTIDNLDCKAFDPCAQLPPECLSPSDLEDVIDQYLGQPTCLPSPVWEGSLLGQEVVVCPEGGSTCTDGSSGCEAVLEDVQVTVDIPGGTGSADFEGRASVPIKVGGTTCDVDIAVEGTAEIFYTTSETQWEGILEISSIDDLVFSIHKVTIDSRGGFVCLFLEGAGDAVRDILEEELNARKDQLIESLTQELAGKYICP